MKISKISPLSRIKSNPTALVKATGHRLAHLTLLLTFCTFPQLTHADETDALPAPEQAAPLEETLPEIEAKSYDVNVVRRSASKRAYLFNDTTDAKPVPGRILLLKNNNEPVMAVRVLKNYAEKKQFAAKRVRTYGDKKILEGKESFLALEKIADIIPQPTTVQDKKDLEDLELDQPAPTIPVTEAPVETPPPTAPVAAEPTEMPAPAEIDEELDDNVRATPKETPEEIDPDDLSESEQPITADEVPSLDNNRNWVSLQGAYLRNSKRKSDGSIASSYNSGMGLRYGITLGRMLFLHQKTLQDSLVIEAGLFLYKIIGYTTTTTGSVATTSNDAYTVVPITGTLRYNLLTSQDLGVFVYGGLMKNSILSSVNATAQAVSDLSSVLPAVGGGLLFRIAPNWHARVDLGYEFIGFGLSLRF